MKYMLQSLSIRNLAIIENVTLPFGKGLSVLTGETGAGKSLLIDGLALLLGERANNELIRQGKDKATVTGVFSIDSNELEGLLRSLNVPTFEKTLVLERSLSRSKSVIRANKVTISLADLRRIAPFLADIHSQFDVTKLFDPANYLSIVDSFAPALLKPLKENYEAAYATYLEKKEAHQNLLAEKEKLEQSKDFYLYQYKELQAMGLKEGEEEEIQNELSLLKNHEQIFALEEEVKELLDGSMLEDLYRLSKNLEKLAGYQSRFEPFLQSVNDAQSALEDTGRELHRSLDEEEYDPEKLNDLEERDFALENLKRKYKKEIPELIAYRDRLKEMLGEGNDFEHRIAEAEKDRQAAFEKTYEAALSLSYARKEVGSHIEKDIEKTLADLLLKSRFKVVWAEPKKEEASLLPAGIDTPSFQIETNVGEGLKPLQDVLSGGEASRIMLALKVLLVKAGRIPTVVFDEIDTGLSGESAAALAKKVKELSAFAQVLSITHLPQLAALSDHHILISKHVKEGRTFVEIKELSLEEKIRQVAYLISGDHITEKQEEAAREMVLGR